MICFGKPPFRSRDRGTAPVRAARRPSLGLTLRDEAGEREGNPAAAAR
jgi:hypothetical protein